MAAKKRVKSLTPKMPGMRPGMQGGPSPQAVASDMKKREDARKRRELAKRMSKKTGGKASGYAAGRTLLGSLFSRLGVPAAVASLGYSAYQAKKKTDQSAAQYKATAKKIASQSAKITEPQARKGQVTLAGEKVKVSDRALKALKKVEVKERAMDKPAKAKDPKAKESVPFKKAFAEARKAGKKEFTWNGKRYHTRTKEEEAAKKKSSAKKATRTTKRRLRGGTTAYGKR